MENFSKNINVLDVDADVSIATGSTPAPNCDLARQYNITALTENTTIGAPTGTPGNSQPLLIRITASGGTRTIAWNATYRVIGVTLPLSLASGKTLYVGCKYNSTASAWDVLAVAVQA
jgi:hypothetical protein